MEPWIQVVLAFAVPSLGGIGWIACKYPTVYAPVFKPVYRGIWALIFIVMVWNVSNAAAAQIIMPFIEKDKLDLAASAVRSIQSPWWVYLLLLGLGLYFATLDILSTLIAAHDHKKDAL